MRSAYDLRSEARIHHHTEPGAQDLQKVFLLHTDMQLFVNMYIYICGYVYVYVYALAVLYIYICIRMFF